MITLTTEQKNAIETVKNTWGKKWKTELQKCWRTGQYSNINNDTAATLQTMRNRIGSRGLEKIK